MKFNTIMEAFKIPSKQKRLEKIGFNEELFQQNIKEARDNTSFNDFDIKLESDLTPYGLESLVTRQLIKSAELYDGFKHEKNTTFDSVILFIKEAEDYKIDLKYIIKSDDYEQVEISFYVFFDYPNYKLSKGTFGARKFYNRITHEDVLDLRNYILTPDDVSVSESWGITVDTSYFKLSELRDE